MLTIPLFLALSTTFLDLFTYFYFPLAISVFRDIIGTMKDPIQAPTLNNYSRVSVGATPPSVNSYVRHAWGGSRYKSDRTKAFEQLMALALKRCEPVYGKEFEVELSVVFGPGGRGDIDNMLKVPVDCVARAGILRDMKGKPMSDSHITRLTVTKERGERPMTTIEIIGVREGFNPFIVSDES